MKRVEIKLNLEAVAPLLDVMKATADQLEPRLAIEPEVPDPEFADDWKQELLAAQRSDLAVLLGLFDSEFFASGVIALDPGNAEQILRACAAIRLRLRDEFFKELEEEHLEAGDINVDDFAEPLRRAFAAYVFLATLQEVIVQHLDPTIIE
ncbi:MAG: hypothetical protein HYV96_04420 [Opitutae bacterium]|nr:hypothetical protein [Opitutae bacterium]